MAYESRAWCGGCSFLQVTLIESDEKEVAEFDFSSGECRRRAPTHSASHSNPIDASPFPRVHITQWCGDFEQSRYSGLTTKIDEVDFSAAKSAYPIADEKLLAALEIIKSVGIKTIGQWCRVGSAQIIPAIKLGRRTVHLIDLAVHEAIQKEGRKSDSESSAMRPNESSSNASEPRPETLSTPASAGDDFEKAIALLKERVASSSCSRSNPESR